MLMKLCFSIASLELPQISYIVCNIQKDFSMLIDVVRPVLDVIQLLCLILCYYHE